MPICPAGHQTSQTDFCDTCGLPLAPEQAGSAVPEPAVEAPTAPITCPQCGTTNVADALFCEACGFDFTTGTAPAAAVPAAPVAAAPVAAAPVAAAPVPVAEHDVVTEPDPTSVFDEESPTSAAMHEDGGPAEVPTEQAAAPVEPAASAPLPPARKAVEWVAELWIDPDWYAAQGSTDPLPSAGLPDIVPLVKDANLVGRVSHSRGIFPDVDCELDTGCSRRHAMLTTDGTRWWIEDLDSANGTFVGSAAGPLPAMPIPQGRVELSPGQRIYVGAWTRIVLRRATQDEKEALAG
ncbi:MAG: FHA domain-containing protein [Propionicimonas sp.]|uniref:FHA domain-containing protein n=1 Tax=Propionicimonas sp. TaxID=1955623 RepID=UPI003D0C583C